MTKQDLLLRAKALMIKGRHEMSKDDLERAIADAEAANEQLVVRSEQAHQDAQNDIRTDLERTAKDLGVEHPAALSNADLKVAIVQREAAKAQSDMVQTMAAEVKPKRNRGSNLNSPWQRKYYYLDLGVYADRKTTGEVGKAPMQVQLILKYMAEHEVTSRRASRQGVDVCSAAVAKRYVSTKIEPHVLFAYYRKRMEGLGLVFAGYNVEHLDPEAGVEADDAVALESAAEEQDDGGSE